MTLNLTYIAVLLTVHNRREQTLNCLKYFYASQPVVGFQIDVYLTDDGCTDGTPEVVIEQYPLVHIVQGDGTLFWNRGMYKAWEAAVKQKNYDFYLWLNDDTKLYNDALINILSAYNQCINPSIICGATRSEITGELTYSGRFNNKTIVPNGMLQECTIINGNFVLIPDIVFQKIGNLDWKFRHAIGDFDYGLRAQKFGIKVYVAPQYIGVCEKNPTLPKWCLNSTPLIQRLKILYSPLGYAEPIPFFIYEKRHFGLIVALMHFLTIHIRVLLPWLWK